MIANMNLKVLFAFICIGAFLVACHETTSKKSKPKVPERKVVVVVGGGIAGMAAARRLVQSGKVDVQVFEAMENRYGGRLWTNRNVQKGIKGVNLEMGGMFLNTAARNNTLLKIVEEFELETTNAGSIRIIFPDKDNEEARILDGKKAIELYSEVFKIVVEAVKSVKEKKEDKPLNEAITDAFEKLMENGHTADFDENDLRGILNSLPTPLCNDFSTLLYEMESELGWDKIVVGGIDNVVDRIVSGSFTDLPLKVELNKIVRQIKVDEKRGKVLIRTADKKQTEADAVVVALPIGALKAKKVYFEPLLPKEWYKAVDGLGLGHHSKIIVGFEKAFWPQNIGSFTVSSSLASDGFLQMWTNAYRISNQPFLIGNIFGKKALKSENIPVDDLKKQVLTVLGQMFGEDTVKDTKLTVFIHTKWLSDPFIMGSVSYPKVGITPEMLEVLKRPVCPHIYFAGAYTELSGHVDSIHGAYNSGIRAAEQILGGVCKELKKTVKSKSSTVIKSNNATSTKKKPKKDEL